VGGFEAVVTADSSHGRPLPLPPLNTSGLTFYWWDAGDSRQVTYTYVSSNNKSKSATATFNVKGLTGNPLITVTTTADGSGVEVFRVLGSNPRIGKLGVCLNTGCTEQTGIAFESFATPPDGYNQSFTWVQLINSAQVKHVNKSGTVTIANVTQESLDNL